nr:hypothetical protein CFP56_72556 [Quercus suber]
MMVDESKKGHKGLDFFEGLLVEYRKWQTRDSSQESRSAGSRQRFAGMISVYGWRELSLATRQAGPERIVVLGKRVNNVDEGEGEGEVEVGYRRASRSFSAESRRGDHRPSSSDYSYGERNILDYR